MFDGGWISGFEDYFAKKLSAVVTGVADGEDARVHVGVVCYENVLLLPG